MTFFLARRAGWSIPFTLLVLVAGLIGLQLEIITPVTFTITVVVALVTNLMTLPLLNRFSPQRSQPDEVAAEEAQPIA